MVCKMLSEARQGVFAVSFHKEPSREDIERRAFQIYMARGRQPGNDIADWLAPKKNCVRHIGESTRAILATSISAKQRELES
jgi:hypothetical protein